MGTSFAAVGKSGSDILRKISSPVGTPPALLQAEPVGLLRLLQQFKQHFKDAVRRLVFIDCLAPYLVLQNGADTIFGLTYVKLYNAMFSARYYKKVYGNSN